MQSNLDVGKIDLDTFAHLHGGQARTLQTHTTLDEIKENKKLRRK